MSRLIAIIPLEALSLISDLKSQRLKNMAGRLADTIRFCNLSSRNSESSFILVIMLFVLFMSAG
jgi:hypothetical protein